MWWFKALHKIKATKEPRKLMLHSLSLYLLFIAGSYPKYMALLFDGISWPISSNYLFRPPGRGNSSKRRVNSFTIIVFNIIPALCNLFFTFTLVKSGCAYGAWTSRRPLSKRNYIPIRFLTPRQLAEKNRH